jgi:glycosyltransferase involved in cell wall biosynthesis
MPPEPLVSVLMPAYNACPYIAAAIESVLAQTYRHFELIILDDGSTDDSYANAATYTKIDPRVRLVSQPHSGVARTRNHLISLAQGEFIAWLDADDLALPHRLERGVNVMLNNPQLVVLGSAYQVIDVNGYSQALHKLPLSDTTIRWHSLFHSPFAQSSVMLRRDRLVSNDLKYDPSMELAEDYDFWSRLLAVGQACNLPEPLVSYRMHPAQISRTRQALLDCNAGRVAQRNIAAVSISLPIDQVQQLRDWFYHFPARLTNESLPTAQALLDILDRFSALPGLDRADLQHIRGRWLGRLLRAGPNVHTSAWAWRLIRRLKPRDWSAILIYALSREHMEQFGVDHEIE